ncbi:hypothetical protein GCM10010965_13460 [Caldalkalibacillus thermarum]|uniref:hypothetical protein n=1 Tax=Caldalkalibacillus thermarum TaxID=296745 RepID=UPI0016686AC0|nr:hypothetical protein [Caldalkalibacillus thermarum]GGK21805.1 hypothetical protein GCM10010965_13460 [Caldalkalibacillus thermarum]
MEKDWVVTQRPGSNQVFRFRPGGPLTDIYGQRWTLQSYILYLFGLDDERPG